MIMLLSFQVAVRAQTDFYIEISGNYSFIPNGENSPSPLSHSGSGYSVIYQQYKTTETYETKPGFDVLTGLSRKLSEKFSLQLGLRYSFIRFKRNVLFEPFPNGLSSFQYSGYGAIKPVSSDQSTPQEFFEEPENVGKTTVSYLSTPITLNYEALEKIVFGAGISSSILLFSKQVKYEMAYTDNPHQPEGLKNEEDNESHQREVAINL